MSTFDDVPLPGLEFALQPRQRDAAVPRRPYSAHIMPSEDTIQRFWAHVVRTPDCWIWTGAISGGDGYGRITWRRDGVSRTMSVHRFALLLAHGDDTTCLVGEHRCNEPLCVRVHAQHVIPSTQAANLQYAVSCGRAGAHRAGSDGRTRAERSRAVRAAVIDGWDPIAYARAAGQNDVPNTSTLF